MPRKKVRRAIKEIKDIVERVPNEGKTAVLEQVLEEARKEPDRRPGAVIAGAKVPWNLHDWDKMDGVVTFTPDETIKFTLNGVSRQFIAGVEGVFPKAFVDTYNRRKKILMTPVKSLPDFGFESQVTLGGGALPSD